MSTLNFTVKTMFWLALVSPNLFAASITLTSPNTPVSVIDGEDFFTDVMNNPIDFDIRRDFMWEENFDDDSINVTNAIWSGIFKPDIDQIYGAYVFPLFQGHGGVDGALNSGLTGINYPLNSAKYNYISVKSTVSARSVNALYWTRDGDWPDGTLSVTGVDCYWTNTTAAMHVNDQSIIYLYDFSTNSSWTDADVTGLRHDASTNQLDGTTVSYDWIRVIDPTTSSGLTITWNTADLPGLPTVPHVKVYVDTDNTGFNGAEIGNVRWGEANVNFNGALKQIPYSNGSFSFPTAILPGGEYFFYLKLYDNKDSNTLLATSGYSSKFTVNMKSSIDFKHPSMTSGKDYATEVLGNPWDMNSSSDIVNLSNPQNQKNFTGEAFVNGVFEATAIIPNGSSQPHTDVQIWLNVDPQNPIDTSRYHYLTYKLLVDDTYYTNIRDKVQYGWVTRAIWWNNDIQLDGSSTKANTTYEDNQTYSFDINPMSVVDPYDTYPSQTGWGGNATISNFRLDPLETSNPEGTKFYIDEVKLTADPEPVNGQFISSFILNDPDNDTMDVDLYLDADNSDFNGVWVGNGSFTNGENEITFSTSNLVISNSYYLYAIITDSAGNITKQYSEVPITITESGNSNARSFLPAIINYLLN